MKQTYLYEYGRRIINAIINTSDYDESDEIKEVTERFENELESFNQTVITLWTWGAYDEAEDTQEVKIFTVPTEWLKIKIADWLDEMNTTFWSFVNHEYDYDSFTEIPDLAKREGVLLQIEIKNN